MIYYFSGTGNSYKVAAQLAQSTSTKLADMSSVAVDVPVCDDAVVGFVLPVYAWGLPAPLAQDGQTSQILCCRCHSWLHTVPPCRKVSV